MLLELEGWNSSMWVEMESKWLMDYNKTRKECCQYVPRQSNGWLGFPVKRKQVIIKDTGLVPAKDPLMLKIS